MSLINQIQQAEAQNSQRDPRQNQTADCEICGTEIPIGTKMCEVCKNVTKESENSSAANNAEQQQNLTADCEICGTQIPIGTEMCEVCKNVKKESESSSAAKNADDVLGQDVVRNGIQNATEAIDDNINSTSGAERIGYSGPRYSNLLDDHTLFNHNRNVQMIHRPQRVFSSVEDNVLNPIKDTDRVKIDRLELVSSQVKKDSHKDYKF
jgi:hypothetical protein